MTEASTTSAAPASREVAEATLRKLLADIKEGRLELYQNVIEQPYVVFRADTHPPGSHHLHSKTVRAWLADWAWISGLGLLRERENDRILTVLEGQAQKTPLPKIEDCALLEILESVPLVAVVYEYLFTRQVPILELQAAPLHKALAEFAQERRLLQLGKKRFPGGPGSLSRAMKDHTRALAALGIDVEIWRSNGSHIRLTRRLDGTCEESSGQSSGRNVIASNDLQTTDAKAEQLARLRALKADRREAEKEGTKKET